MNRNTLVLLGALVALAAIAYFLMQRPGEQSLPSSEGDPLLRVDSASIDKIKIDSPDLSLILVKHGSEWRIENPLTARANQNAVGDLLHDAGFSMIKARVSDKPEKHSLFQVDSTGIAITFFRQEAEQASVIIGKQGPGYTDVYARPAKSNEVCLVDAAVSRSAHRPLKDWRDRTIVSVPRESVKDIRFQYGDTTFAVAWRDSVWTIDSRIADDAAVNTLLGSLSTIQADEFLDTPPAKPRLAATISFAGMQLRFSQTKGTDSYAVQSSASAQWFEVQSWRAQQILKRKKDLLKAPS